LVKAFLKAGVMTIDGDREETWTGTPQGGILSPLLANIALSALDEYFDRQWRQEMSTWRQRTKRKNAGQGNWKLIRFADDFVLMVSGDQHHAEDLREEVAAVLAPMGLRLAPEKTHVVHIDEGFDFLGHNIRRQRKRGTSKHYVYTRPSKKAVQAIKDKVSAKTYRSTRNMDLDELIASLNRMLAGWANYFRYGISKAVFGTIDHHAWGRFDALDTPQIRGQDPSRNAAVPPSLLRPGLADRPQRGHLHRRIQRRGEALPLPRQQHCDPLDPDIGSHHQ